MKGLVMSEGSNKKLMIYVPATVRAEAALPDDEAETHALRATIGDAIGKVSTVRVDDVQDQWNSTLDTLINLSSDIATRAEAWKIEEIEVGLTLSAKGELLFIAEAGAEASIKITLKPKSP
jgi:hypothetical protein